MLYKARSSPKIKSHHPTNTQYFSHDVVSYELGARARRKKNTYKDSKVNELVD